MYFTDFKHRISFSSHPLVDAVTMHPRIPCCTAAAAACMDLVSSMASSLDLQGPVLNLHFLCCLSTCAKPAHQMRVLRGHGRKHNHVERLILEAIALSELCMHTC